MGTARPGVRTQTDVRPLIQTSPSRLFGRRKGRPLRARKATLLKELLPELQIILPEKKPLDPKTLFSHQPKEIWLEIGFGGGEHLAEIAAQNPHAGFLGAEPFVNGIASLLDHIDRRKLSNIRIFPNDARKLLDALPAASIDCCFILFPDPWPKVRHAERRFVGPENLPRLARAMKKGAGLHLATDDPKLAPWMSEHMAATNAFSAQFEPCNEPPLDWVSTRYEQKALKAGRRPVYFGYIRTANIITDKDTMRF